MATIDCQMVVNDSCLELSIELEASTQLLSLPTAAASLLHFTHYENFQFACAHKAQCTVRLDIPVRATTTGNEHQSY